MIFQSKFRNHQIVIRPTTFEYFPGIGKKLVRGLSAKFAGPQRLFDPEFAAKENQWTDEEREHVENWLFEHPKFMVDFFPAPGQQIPEERQETTKRKPRAVSRRCTAIGYENGQLIQCDQEATAGRDFCHKHDPGTQTIKKGLGTTVG